MTTLQQKQILTNWFKELQQIFITELEDIESSYVGTSAPFTFEKSSWKRSDREEDGGTMAVMRGEVFEKVGVNFSVVQGEFSPEFSKNIPGAVEDPRFWASGLSFVAHPRNPYVPIAHLNTRHIVTTRSWFGGGGDLTPTFPFEDDTQEFHQSLKDACDTHGEEDYAHFKKWCDEYFYLPHRKEPRGVGGIFFDNLSTDHFEKDFKFIQIVGINFIKAYAEIVRRRMQMPWDEMAIQQQRIKRARYVEFNLLYDRGTLFGLKTGGNTEAILMSLPPLASWA